MIAMLLLSCPNFASSHTFAKKIVYFRMFFFGFLSLFGCCIIGICNLHPSIVIAWQKYQCECILETAQWISVYAQRILSLPLSLCDNHELYKINTFFYLGKTLFQRGPELKIKDRKRKKLVSLGPKQEKGGTPPTVEIWLNTQRTHTKGASTEGT